MIRKIYTLTTEQCFAKRCVQSGRKLPVHLSRRISGRHRPQHQITNTKKVGENSLSCGYLDCYYCYFWMKWFSVWRIQEKCSWKNQQTGNHLTLIEWKQKKTGDIFKFVYISVWIGDILKWERQKNEKNNIETAQQL